MISHRVHDMVVRDKIALNGFETDCSNKISASNALVKCAQMVHRKLE